MFDWQVDQCIDCGIKFMKLFATRDEAVEFAQSEIKKNSGIGAMSVDEGSRIVVYDVLADR